MLCLPRSWSQRTSNQVLCLEVFGFSAISGWGTTCPSESLSIFFLGWADRKKAYNLHPAAPSRQSFWPSTSEFLFKDEGRISLVVQWIRIRLPMQGTQVWSLIQEDSTCQVGMKPVGQNYWARALERTNRAYWGHVPGVHAPQQEKPPQWEAWALQLDSNPRSPQREKAPVRHEDPAQRKIKLIKW